MEVVSNNTGLMSGGDGEQLGGNGGSGIVIIAYDS